MYNGLDQSQDAINMAEMMDSEGTRVNDIRRLNNFNLISLN